MREVMIRWPKGFGMQTDERRACNQVAYRYILDPRDLVTSRLVSFT